MKIHKYIYIYIYIFPHKECYQRQLLNVMGKGKILASPAIHINAWIK